LLQVGDMYDEGVAANLEQVINASQQFFLFFYFFMLACLVHKIVFVLQLECFILQLSIGFCSNADMILIYLHVIVTIAVSHGM
jgi:hypothetical protein